MTRGLHTLLVLLGLVVSLLGWHVEAQNLSTDAFGFGAVSATAVWDGGLALTFRGNRNCVYTSANVRDYFMAVVEVSSPVSEFGWTTFQNTILRSNTIYYTASNQTSTISATLGPAVGFVLLANANLTFRATLVASLTNCSTSTNNLTIRANAIGGFATMALNVTNEFDVQRSGLQLTVTLQYNRFLSGATVSVACDNDPTLNSGWTFVVVNGVTLVGTRPAVPTFNLAAGTVATVLVTISSAAVTFLNRLPTPTSSTFFISSVDGTPLSQCTLSSPNVTDLQARTSTGIVDLTLAPSTADNFVYPLSSVDTATIWNSIIPAAQVPATVGIAFTVVSAWVVRINVTAAATFYLNSAVSIVFTPQPAALQSGVAGCGVVRLQLVPGPGITAAINPVNVTEGFINSNSISFTFTIQGAEFALSGPLPVTFSSTFASQNATIQTPFALALVQDNVSIVATNKGGQAEVVIPALPSYNIDETYTECVVIQFLGGATLSGVAPITTSATPTVCFRGVMPNITLAFRSSNSTSVNASTLWKTGDALEVKLAGAVWNTSANWSTAVPPPAVVSLYGSLESLGFPPVNFSAVSFIARGRIAVLPFVPCVGLSVPSNEIGFVTSYRQLTDNSNASLPPNISFSIRQASSDVVGFTCDGGCSVTPEASLYNVTEQQVRAGFWFTISSIYDILVNETMLRQLGWSLFTRNATSFVSSPAPPALSVSKINNYTANFSFAALPDFDISVLDENSVVYVSSAYVRNGFMQSTPRGFLNFVFNRSQPTCTLTNITPPLSEVAIQTASVNLILATTLPMIPALCSKIANQLVPLPFTLSSEIRLNVSVGNCSLATNQILPLVVQQNASYFISTSDVLTFLFNRSYFSGGERCAVNPAVEIPALPAVAAFSFSYWDASRNRTVNLAFDPAAGAVVISERTIRLFGLNISVSLTGELLVTCSFLLRINVNVGDVSRPFTNFVALLGLVNMTATSSCVVNRSTNATFAGFIHPQPMFDIASTENITFFINVGVGSGSERPTLVNSTVVLDAQSEDVMAAVIVGGNSGGGATNSSILSMRPLPPIFAALNTTAALSLLPTTLVPSWSFVTAVITAEQLALGGFQYVFLLTGDRWLSRAPSLVFSGISVMTSNLTSSTQLDTSMLALLFPFSLATVAYNATTRISTLLLLAPAVPSFYCTENIRLEFSLVPDTIDSGIAPTPPWVALNVTSGPPKLVASGPALLGGTRRLLLGQLFLIVRMEFDNFVPSSISGPLVCPPTFVTCSIVLDASRRVMNITFPPQDLVLFSTTTYYLNVTSDQAASGRPISNNVSFQLSVESGILVQVYLGQQLVSAGMSVDEALFRNGLIGSLTFVLEGDSFVTSERSILTALLEQTTCAPYSDEFGFCTRLANMITGSVEPLEARRQVIRVSLQPDALFDVYRNEAVTLTFGGIATSSTFQPIFLQPLNFDIVASRGVLTMTSTASSSKAAPLPASMLIYGTQVLQWTFALAGERWNIGSKSGSTPLQTPDGTPIRQLLLDAFVSSGNCSSCFAARKPFLFPNDVSVSADQRTLTIQLTPDALYAPASSGGENISIVFTNPALFRSALVPVQTTTLSGDWKIFIAPSGTAVSVTSVNPVPITPTSVTSAALHVYVSDADLRDRGVNVTVALDSQSGLCWNYTSAGLDATSFVSTYSTSSLSVAAAPLGYLALRTASSITAVPTTATCGSSITFCFAALAAYSLAIREEVVTVRLPTAWVYITVRNAPAAGVLLLPAVVNLHVVVSQVTVTAIVALSSRALLSGSAGCRSPALATSVASNVSLFLGVGPSVVSVATSQSLPLAPSSFCNVSISIGSSSGELDLRALQANLVASSPAELAACCDIVLAYVESSPPTEAQLRAAIGVAPVPSPEQPNIGKNLAWALGSLGVLAVIGVIMYVVRQRSAGSAYAGASRIRVDENADVLEMKLVVEEDLAEVELQRKRRLAEAERHRRFHEDHRGNPRLSDVMQLQEHGEDNALQVHDTIFAGQPTHDRLFIGATQSGHGTSIVPVELPILEEQDDIPIAPTSIDGFVDAAASTRGSRPFRPRVHRGSRTAPSGLAGITL